MNPQNITKTYTNNLEFCVLVWLSSSSRNYCLLGGGGTAFRGTDIYQKWENYTCISKAI